MNLKEIREAIKNTKNMKELNEYRVPIIEAIHLEDDVTLFQETQKSFIKQKNKIKQNGGKIND